MKVTTLYDQLEAIVKRYGPGTLREHQVHFVRCIERTVQLGPIPGLGRQPVTLVKRTFPAQPKANIISLQTGRRQVMIPADPTYHGMEGKIPQQNFVEAFLRHYGGQ